MSRCGAVRSVDATRRKELALDTYVILRRDGWRSGEELGEAAARSTAEGEKMADDVRWIRSYVLEEGNGVGTVCIYQATSPEAIRAHAAAADLPVDEIVRVVDTVIIRPDPGAGRRLRRGIMTRTRLVVAALLALSLLPLAGRAFADTNADVAAGAAGHRAVRHPGRRGRGRWLRALSRCSRARVHRPAGPRRNGCALRQRRPRRRHGARPGEARGARLRAAAASAA